ncbi:hypothetical protein LTR97_001008 [Elasticomyces elasticus]|uniref:Uncharacterized protein n=1 Tax=Elasticomyces elasticus TaxID=574655 RepID=A0AAN7WBV8_9PEZI|nr:hypothetical protein LTR97_001008 [Elasticomyces elasticus]
MTPSLDDLPHGYSVGPVHRTPATRLREMLNSNDGIVTCPGVYDGLTARIALNAGFKCLYMTGAGTAISRLGMPDLGITTLQDMVTNAGMIASLDWTVPLIADADTGYGGPLMVARTVEAYISAGVAALHLEDQVVNKRCGHLLGKELVDEVIYLGRIRAAVLARERMRAAMGDAGDIVLIARTDALQSLGFEVALDRLQKAIEVGADVAFLEGFTSVQQGKDACERLSPTPVLLNMVPGGATPDFTSAEAQEAGFKIIIFPGLMLAAAYGSCVAAAVELKHSGTITVTEKQRKEGPKGIFTAVGLLDCLTFDKKAGGTSYEAGV